MGLRCDLLIVLSRAVQLTPSHEYEGEVEHLQKLNLRPRDCFFDRTHASTFVETWENSPLCRPSRVRVPSLHLTAKKVSLATESHDPTVSTYLEHMRTTLADLRI